MSSHHFVREGQEPALLILDADSSDVVMSLLEWSPTVLVSSKVLASVLLWGVKIDAIVTCEGDDMAQLGSMSFDQGPVKIINGGVTKSQLSNALSSLSRQGQKSVNIISRSPADHFTEVQHYLDRLDIAFVNETLKWFPVARRFEKWYPANTVLRVHTFDRVHDINVGNGARDYDIIKTGDSGLVSINSDKSLWIGEASS
ncbi:MAG: hypothetical protein ABI477_07710 [Chryseolinea sp.]